MAFNFNWAPQRIPTKLKGQANLPEIEQPFDFNSYFTNLVNREEMDGYHPAQNFSVPNQQHGGNPAVNYAGYSPTTPMSEQDVINQNLAERQTGNADDMANWIQQGGTPQADAAAAAQAQAEQEAAAKEQQIADIESQISALEKRIAENTAKLEKWTGNADQIAAIEARKINSADPTSIWRWKVGRDEARRIAKMEKDKTDQLAATNAMYEIQNELDSIIVDKNLDSATQKLYLSKLANLKTLAQKNKLSTASIDAKIKEVKGDKVGETSRDIATTDFETLMNNPNLSIELLDEFEASNPNLSRADWGKLDNKKAELVNKANKKAENEAKAKERETKILGMNPNSVMSDEISFMEKRGYKRITGDKLSDTKWVKVK
jgi:hypothetical protein